MRFILFYIALGLLFCSANKGISPYFNAYTYIQDNYYKYDLKLDTLHIRDTPSRYPTLIFHFKNSCNERFLIEKTTRIKNPPNDTFLNYRSRSISFDGIEGLKKTDVKTTVRTVFSLIVFNDSVVYRLTWKGIGKNTDSKATKQLYLLKSFITSNNEIMAQAYIDSIKLACKDENN